MAEFDTSILLSTFFGPDEDPLSENNNWTQTVPSRAPLQRKSNRATNSASGDPNFSHWVHPAQEVDGVVEVYGCTEGGQLGADLETWRVALWSIVGGALSGFQVYFGGALSKDTVIRRYDGGVGSFTPIASAPFHGYPSRLGLRLNGDEVEAWEDHGAGWVLECSANDPAYRGGDWYGGLGIETSVTNTNTFSCFALSITPRRTQIYRIIRGFAST